MLLHTKANLLRSKQAGSAYTWYTWAVYVVLITYHYDLTGLHSIRQTRGLFVVRHRFSVPCRLISRSFRYDLAPYRIVYFKK